MKTFAKAIAKVTFGVDIEGDELNEMVNDMLKDFDLNKDNSKIFLIKKSQLTC